MECVCLGSSMYLNKFFCDTITKNADIRTTANYSSVFQTREHVNFFRYVFGCQSLSSAWLQAI